MHIGHHFHGSILPPLHRRHGGMGDPVTAAVADYASKVLARSGLLTVRNGLDERSRLDEYGKVNRAMFTIEHALAIDLGRVASSTPLRLREARARAVLALAAYWCDRSQLEGLQALGSHPLLGARPTDALGRVLHDHAASALAGWQPKAPKGSGRLGNSAGIDFGIGISAGS